MKRTTALPTLGLTLALLMFAGSTLQAETPDGDCDQGLTAQVVASNNSGITGTAAICIDEDRTRVLIDADQLQPGNVYTVWFGYLDNPLLCSTPGCSPVDFLGDDPVGVFGRMDGQIADAHGRARFSGKFSDLRYSKGSFIWLIMFGHGPVADSDLRQRARQLLTPQAPIFGVPGLGTVSDGALGKRLAVAKFVVTPANEQ